ncbi:MAG: aminotransferase class IV [Wenzhouxiangellaceae bacterium]
MVEWLVDGRADAGIPADDRGLLHGDGVFETIAFFGCTAPLWGLHMQRLKRGCDSLGIAMPDAGLLLDEAAGLASEAPRCVIRITVTRGSGGSGYFPPQVATVRRIVARRAFPEGLDELRRSGLNMRTSAVRLATHSEAPGLKHVSRLDQVLIARECRRTGADEALVLDRVGNIVEALHGNVVIVRAGRLIAPGPHPVAVAGVGLEWLRRSAGSRLEEGPFPATDLRPDDSIWVINSVRGPGRVRSLDGRLLERDGEYPHWLDKWREEVEKCSASY